MTIDISVIVPNLNSGAIDRTLDALRRQEFALSTVEVLVVGLDKPGLVSTDNLVRHIDTRTPRSAAQNRNRGIAEAQGQILCFTDADCVPAVDWLARLTAPFADANVAVVGGAVEFDAANYWAMCDNISWFYRFLATSPGGEREHLPSLNLSVRREIVGQVGGYNEDFPHAAGEDTEWTLRIRAAGHALQFEPRALVRHSPARSTARQLWRHAYSYGRYSSKIRPDDKRGANMAEAEWLPRRWWLLIVLAPLYAGLATARVVASRANQATTWLAVPGIWLSKLGWCFGASAALRDAAADRQRRRPDGQRPAWPRE